jgi:hypothetical protein
MEAVRFSHMGGFFESSAQCLKQSVPVNADLTFFVKIPLGTSQGRGILQPEISFFRLSDSAAAPEIREARGSKYRMYSRIPPDEEAVKAWLRAYSSGLASVGVRLGLSRRQQSELEHRLLVACRGPGGMIATKEGLRAASVVECRSALAGRLLDPIRSRWLSDHLSAQGDPSTGA